MADEMREQEQRPRVAEMQQIEPVTDPEAAQRADQILAKSTKANSQLGIVGAEFAIDPDLKESPAFNYRKKLILAEVLRLMADSLDPAQQENLGLAKLREYKKKLDEAVSLGVGQMLRRLRSREELANRMILWKANGMSAKERALPKGQTSIMIGPNKLGKKSFQKVVDHELKSTNLHIGKGEYRSFMFLPLEKIKGGTMAMLPFMHMAAKYHMLVVGSLPVADSLDSAPDTYKKWRFNINDVDADDLEVLSHATIVMNNLIVRDPYEKYFEDKQLNVGLETAFAAQMTKYFQRKKVGHWYIPVLHPKIKAKDMRTVNMVDKLDSWRKAVENQFNFAYTTTEKQDPNEPGVRIYGGTTVFPEATVDKDSMGSQIVPLVQAQARAVKNRIFDQLSAELEKQIGGQLDEDDVRKKVHRYLDSMFLQKQIYGFEILEVSKSETGVFRIKVQIRWSPTAEEFVIDATGKSEESTE